MNNPFAKFGIDHLSPSQINKFSTSPASWIVERLFGVREGSNAPMNAGTAAEQGIVAGLFDPKMEVTDCVEIAMAKFQQLMFGNTDSRREKYTEALPGMVQQGLAHLRPYGIPTETQVRVQYDPEGLAVPIIGLYDVFWGDHGIVTDIKTTMRMPSQIKLQHARQVALYKHAISDNIEARVSYITPTKAETYRADDTRQHREALVLIGKIMQRLLSLSDDPREVAQFVCPDYEHLYLADPRVRKAALDIWGF